MARATSTHKNTDMPLRGARILIVEDDALLLMELESILQEAGAEIVTCCRNVRDALVAAEQSLPAAAILDVARRLANLGTPFLFYTGQLEDDPTLAEWRCHVVLSKPTRAAAIVAAVAHLLKPSRAE
jgi:DNA-binding response OmpR family regulator